MLGKIISIKSDETFWLLGLGHLEGVSVVTDKHKFFVGIELGQRCCENYGYLTSEDIPTEYIGANLLSVEVVDEDLKTFDIEDSTNMNAMFVNFTTSVGTYQVVVYNEHNGYYGHEVVVVKNGVVEHEETL